ncbi:hypothetical protein ABK046_50080, partial [Streptomyces caeruleatus]
EFLGSVGPNQQIWMQILIQAHIKDRKVKGKLFEKEDSWIEDAKKELNEKILLRDPKTKVSGVVNPDTGFAKLPSLTEIERET